MSEQAHPFDAHLLKHVTTDWHKIAKIVGTAIMEITQTQRSELKNGLESPLDLLFAERLKELVEQGRLESKGDLARMGFCELRLPARSCQQSVR